MVLAAAAALRCWKLDQPLMWCDEAESAINALTVLEHGYPTDKYLGKPIYENVFSEPWPESEEYEFRDSSYSKRGLAVYHGWLPLYVMAGSMHWFNVEPATDPARLQGEVFEQRDGDAHDRRTHAVGLLRDHLSDPRVRDGQGDVRQGRRLGGAARVGRCRADRSRGAVRRAITR